MARKQLGEQPHHHLAVLEHVGHARWHAQVVLEHKELAFTGAHNVHPGDMCIDAAGHIEPLHLRPELRIVEDFLGGDNAGLEDVLVVIDVVEEQVEGAQALLQPGFEGAPLSRR